MGEPTTMLSDVVVTSTSIISLKYGTDFPGPGIFTMFQERHSKCPIPI
jgi:hypothetical protein